MLICFRGKNVLNQKSELQKALSKHKEKQLMNQIQQHRETPGNIFLYETKNNNKVQVILVVKSVTFIIYQITMLQHSSRKIYL